MYVLWVTLQVQPEHREEFLDAITANAAASVRDEPGCLGFDVLEIDCGENRFAFYEKYADAEAFHTGHKDAPHFAQWRAVAAKVVVPGSQVNTFGDVVTSEAPAAVSGGVA